MIWLLEILKNGNWVGYADILRRIDGESKLGDYFYNVEDAKLAQITKAGTILQLCLYSEMIAEIQGVIPRMMSVVKPGNPFETMLSRATKRSSPC